MLAISAEPTHTNICVLIPAALPLLSRSNPTTTPATNATNNRSMISHCNLSKITTGEYTTPIVLSTIGGPPVDEHYRQRLIPLLGELIVNQVVELLEQRSEALDTGDRQSMQRHHNHYLTRFHHHY